MIGAVFSITFVGCNAFHFAMTRRAAFSSTSLSGAYSSASLNAVE